MEVEVSHDKIDEFCRRWHINELSLFGSVLREDFNLTSDIDVMARFNPDAHCTLFDMVHMENELKEIFGREFDLISRGGIEASRTAGPVGASRRAAESRPVSCCCSMRR